MRSGELGIAWVDADGCEVGLMGWFDSVDHAMQQALNAHKQRSRKRFARRSSAGSTGSTAPSSEVTPDTEPA